tara:strand:- start:67 stop:630 length:564 start_codon:yes stop_codon:yes gene_type:complete
MWMTPFYLFFGVLLVYIFQSKINLNKLQNFAHLFIFLFILSSLGYGYISVSEQDKRTDYPGKQIAEEIQFEWDKAQGKNKIKYVLGDEWHAGNLSYHLKSRPKVIFIPPESEPGKYNTGLTGLQEFKLLIATGFEIYHSIVEIKSVGKNEIGLCTLIKLAWLHGYISTEDFKSHGTPKYINYCFINK